MPARTYEVPRKFVLFGFRLDNVPIIEEKRDDAVTIHFEGDPRYCPVVGPHPLHRYSYAYRRHWAGEELFGEYICFGHGLYGGALPVPARVVQMLREGTLQ